MANPTKRHYRVAQRDKALDEEYTALTEETLGVVASTARIMYAISILISFMLGYAIGHKK